MIISAYRSFFLFLAGFLGEGWAIVALSCVCSALMMPLMRVVAGVVRRESAYQDVILPQVAKIKEMYAGDMERNLHIQRLYARYGYSPLSAVKKVLPLFVQIPFLLLTYYMLKGTAELNGVQFLFLKNLGTPDALLHGCNLLPFVMTGVNLLTVVATPGFTKRDQVQAVVISLLFLVLLYTAPSALLLYWTLNNVITMVRTMFGTKCAGARLLGARLRTAPQSVCGFLKPTSLGGSPWRFALRVACGFVALNLCGGLFLWAFFSWSVPVEVKIDNEAPGAITIFLASAQSSAERVYAKSLRPPTLTEPTGLYREYFSNEDLEDVPAFKITSTATGVVAVRSFIESFFGIVEKRMDGTAFANAFRTIPEGRLTVGSDGTAHLTVDCDNAGVELIPLPWANSQWSYSLFSSRRIRLLVVVLEILLLIFSIVGVMYLRPSLGIWNGVVECVAVATVVAGYLTYMLPFQTFIANRSDYPFGVFDFLVSEIWPCVLVAIVVFSVVYVSKFGLGMLLPVLLMAVLFYEFVQTGILSFGAPRLNGDTSYYSNASKAFADFAVFGVILSFACIFYYSLKNKIIFLVKVFCVLTGVSLVAIWLCHRNGEVDPGFIGLDPVGYRSRLTVANAVKWSTKRNVLIFVLDSCTTEVAHDVFNKNPDIAKKFDGFSAFENNVGMHHESNFATVGLMTGEYYDSPYDQSLVDAYMRKTFETNSLLSVYCQAGANVYFLPTVYPCGYAFPSLAEIKVSDEVRRPLFARPEGGMSFTLYELLRFRLTPFYAKARMFAFTFAAMPGHGRVDLESQLYPILERASVADDNMTFAFFHTEGAHIPYDITEDGRSVQPPQTGYAAYLRKATYVFRRLGMLLDTLREKSVYDNSFILIVADHGPHVRTDTVKYSSIKNSLPINGRPMLLVKPFSEIASFEEDGTTPTSLSKVYGLLGSLLEENPSMEDVRKRLQTMTRLYVHPGRPSSRWLVDATCQRID